MQRTTVFSAIGVDEGDKEFEEGLRKVISSKPS
jgi:hypothetical protein